MVFEESPSKILILFIILELCVVVTLQMYCDSLPEGREAVVASH